MTHSGAKHSLGKSVIWITQSLRWKSQFGDLKSVWWLTVTLMSHITLVTQNRHIHPSHYDYSRVTMTQSHRNNSLQWLKSHCDESHSLQWLTFNPVTQSHYGNSVIQMIYSHFDESLWLTFSLVTNIYSDDSHTLWWLTFTPVNRVTSMTKIHSRNHFEDSAMTPIHFGDSIKSCQITHIHSYDSHPFRWLISTPAIHLHSNDWHSLW